MARGIRGHPGDMDMVAEMECSSIGWPHGVDTSAAPSRGPGGGPWQVAPANDRQL